MTLIPSNIIIKKMTKKTTATWQRKVIMWKDGWKVKQLKQQTWYIQNSEPKRYTKSGGYGSLFENLHGMLSSCTYSMGKYINDSKQIQKHLAEKLPVSRPHLWTYSSKFNRQIY